MRGQTERWLAGRGEPSSRTQKLTDLIVLLGDATLADLADEVRALDRFYISACHPDALPGMLLERLPGEEEARKTLA